MEKISVTITENEAGQRFDRFLKKYLQNAPAGLIYKMIRKKQVRVNEKKVKAHYRLKPGDIVEFRMNSDKFSELTQQKSIKKLPLKFNVIYEDKNILTVAKPPGIPTHPGENSKKDNLTDMVLTYLYKEGKYHPAREKTFSPAPVNRLDFNTSGLVLFAKNYSALKILNRMTREGKIEKYYICLVKGRLEGERIITGYLTKDEKTKKVTISNLPGDNAKRIKTRYRALKYFHDCTLVEIKLITGRQHQIRAHLLHIGHPIAGDIKYGDAGWNNSLRKKFGLFRQFLHAYRINFKEGDGILEYLTEQKFEAHLYKDLEKVIAGYPQS